jgi:hypothetical protein
MICVRGWLTAVVRSARKCACVGGNCSSNSFPSSTRCPFSISVAGWQAGPGRQSGRHLEDPPAELPDWATAERADVCDLPADFSNRHFDLVFSNSLIEHVGGHYRREQLATVIRRSAQQYWVQTPYRYFPIEPHFLFPAFQFMPATVRAGVARRWPLLHTPSSDRTNAISTVLSTELIGRTEMQFYFPDSVIYGERIAGVTKSLVAVKR